MRNPRRTVRAAAAIPVLVLVLAACGGSDDTATPASGGATDAAAAQGGPGAGGGFGGADMTAIQDCLTAAGISLPTPSGGARPSGGTAGTPPTDRPTDGSGASGGSAGGPGGGMGGGTGGGMFQSEEVQAALKACGITVPTGGAGRPAATPSAAATTTT